MLGRGLEPRGLLDHGAGSAALGGPPRLAGLVEFNGSVTVAGVNVIGRAGRVKQDRPVGSARQ